MKKILYSFLFLCFACSVQAQILVNVTAPSSNQYIPGTTPFSFSQKVKLIVDISGVSVLAAEEAAGRPIYIWAFIQGCCGSPNNGQWENSNEANRMTKESDGKWSFTFSSVGEFVGASYAQAKAAAKGAGRVEDQTRLGFLVKGKSGVGDIKSGDMEISFTGPVYVVSEFSTFPGNFATEDVVTFTYNQNLEDDPTMKTQTEAFIYIEGDVAGGSTVIPVSQANVGTSTTPSMKMTDKGGKMYSYTFVPSRLFNLTAGQRITTIRVTIRSKTDQNINGGQKILSPFRAQ